ncbi:LacI family DNA-binding transcriptional regulator [Paenibacillus larvae]|nr:LacI family DNA-binding transcriptional regulator [Paenibacillus larvae]AVF21915.1 HTH-type transcriptional regulator EbgR [Paenibacillus larvae subsp. larvae]AVF26095.1 HTH-type transcriptional regulator EbgR [Paenibacillus larvae subsp. larvae]AVF30873.1 HTH-type transcriptional regulator EbgR [Paenibacillus larvae subsp. larvae]MCY7476334.1 LacI family DNA-binding transcriptional regulator [Paenibacillus larvae]MCY7489727.1 LacI family DNA-binding transcriptional regulator [Paenibacillus
MATLKDIAELAHVSISTVSRVLNNDQGDSGCGT